MGEYAEQKGSRVLEPGKKKCGQVGSGDFRVTSIVKISDGATSVYIWQSSYLVDSDFPAVILVNHGK